MGKDENGYAKAAEKPQSWVRQLFSHSVPSITERHGKAGCFALWFKNMVHPRVSVIVNVRNGAASLHEALESVFAQTFTDWELICWDDRSTDESAQIISRYTRDRVRYFLSPDETPLGQARDAAIREAQGEWLAFLDQDDIWLPDKLQKQIALVDGDPGVGIVYGRTVMFSAHGAQRDFDHRHEFQPLPEGNIFERLFIDSCFISMSSSVLRRSAVEEIGRIPNYIRVVPDYYLFVAVARHYQARAVQEVVCRYRLHDTSMSASNRIRMHEEALMVVESWAHCLNPRLLDRRRKVHSTVIAVEEIRHTATAGKGLARLFTGGSIGYLLSRPFAKAFRFIRRIVQRPFWQAL